MERRSGASAEARRCGVAGVEAALLEGGFLPPPAALALVLAGMDGTRAGLAADGDEAAVVERVVGHVVLADVGPDLLRGPVGQRVELEQGPVGRAEGGIELDDGDGGARAGALILALAGHPGLHRAECADERLDLADAAALLVAVLVERE